MAENSGKKEESAGTLKIAIVLYDRAAPGMHRAGPGERGGAPYSRRTVERAAIQISGGGKGLTASPDDEIFSHNHESRPHATRTSAGPLDDGC